MCDDGVNDSRRRNTLLDEKMKKKQVFGELVKIFMEISSGDFR